MNRKRTIRIKIFLKKEAAYKEVSMEVDKALKVVVVCVECAASVVAIIKN